VTTNDMTIKIGGEAGQGVESTGRGFATALVRGGLYVFGLQDYHSRIRGGHNFYQIRVSDQDLFSHDERVHLLLALTKVSIREHRDEIVPGGGIIYDPGLSVEASDLGDSAQPFPVPLAQIATDVGGSKVMANTAAIGAAAGLTGLDLTTVLGVIRENFAKKGGSVVDANLRVATAAQDYVRHRYSEGLPFRLQAVKAPPRMLISGNEALAMGALVGGCNFVAGYPMTPGSPILEWLSVRSAEWGIVTKHTEDEIAAVNMIIGAAHMGARAMTTTSGGGFALMVEGLGLAGMCEVPIVIVNVQRPGPATGHATRHEQSDLLFMIHATQGEFPRIVLAPGTIEECFEVGHRAFNLAERFQTPVLIISDAFLAHSPRALELGSLRMDAAIDRGSLLSAHDLQALTVPYKRFADTPSGVSPRALPGHPKAVYSASSDEHDEFGLICEDAAVRIQQDGKRMRKLEAARAEMGAPRRYGPPDAELTFVTWGSTVGPLRSAMDQLARQGKTANIVQITDIWPLPSDKVHSVLKNANKIICVEQNYTGQLETLLRAYAGVGVDSSIRKYDGRPMSPEYVLSHLKGVAQ